MKKNQSGLWTGLSVVLAAVVYSIAVFALIKDMTYTRWIAYGFCMVGFLALLVGLCGGSGSGKGYPAFEMFSSGISVVYFCLQFILSGIVILFFKNFSTTLTAVVGFVILAVYVVISLFLYAGKDKIRAQDEYEGKKVSSLRLLTAEANAISSMIPQGELKKRMEKLAEVLRYSDPMTQPAVAAIDERINSNLSLLREDIQDGEMGQAADRVTRLEQMVTERNEKCMALKR